MASPINIPAASEIPDMSMWGLSQEAASANGTLLTLFNGKIHEAMTCVTDQLTQRGYLSEIQNKILTDLKGATLKYFNENFPPDLSMLPISSLDLSSIAAKEIGSSIFTVKEHDSPFDWIMFTTSSYRDREGQIISLKAHEQDVLRMNLTGDFGTLDYWHLHPVVFEKIERPERVALLPKEVRENGIILGDCTFSAMYNKIRIEAGTYRSPLIKEVMDAHKDEHSASILYFHPSDEPRREPDGEVFDNIWTVSRAMMPRSEVSNLVPFLQGVM